MSICWCGNTDLQPFGPEYGECRVCGTLVSQKGLSSTELLVNDDKHDFYGKQYWLGHQKQDLGFPDIYNRARNDLTERNLHWLKALLKYRLPPADVLEPGCAHGSFIALMRQAGYQAAGVEMSPWVVAFGQEIFGIPVRTGPVESLDVAPASLNVIALMDVLEHLPDPTATMRHCLELLKPKGLLLIQTPQFKEGMRHKGLVKSKHTFLDQLKSDEHLYLFSERSVTEFFRRLGAEHIRFEPAIFAHYDMFFAVSRAPLKAHKPEEIESALLATPNGRLALAMLDLRERELNLARKCEESEIDRVARGEQIESLTAMLRESEADRAARSEQIESLTVMLKESESDRAERAKQIASLTAMLKESEADRAKRAKQIEALTVMLKESETDRAARSEQIESLTVMLKESESDRAARSEQIESLSVMLKESETDRAARGEQIESLSVMLKESETDRAARSEQIESLSVMLKTSEADRAERAKQIESLSVMLKTSEADRAERAKQIASLTAMLKESEADRAERAKQIASLTAMLKESEADRAKRAKQIESLSVLLKESETDRAKRAEQIEALTGMLKESESDRAARGEQIESLSVMLKTSEADRAERAKQIEALTGMLKESESDRVARGEQIESLTGMLKESETDRAARSEQIEALTEDLRALFSRPAFRWLTRFASWPEVKKLAEQFGTPNFGMNKSLRTIAVDLTPVLPGGENGGAKIFVLELLRRLAEMAPQTQFVLLTQAASHEELAALERTNMRRLMVVGPVVTNSLRPLLLGLASRVLPHLPTRLRSAVSRLGYSLNAALKRSGSGALLRDMGADLLFCPFTAPTYFEPGIPTVCTIYDLQYKTYPEFFAAEDVAHRDRIFIEACRRASSLTAISDYSRDSAVAHGSLDPARIRTIHLRMAQRISPRAEHDKAVLSRLGLTPQQYLIYPANFWKHKNHEMLLTAFGMACHEGLAADIKLVCTGAPGARQEWLMSAARNMNLADRVLFPGYLPNAELAALMANCSGVVFPSLYEGFGLPVIEAMAAGVPVACSNTTSLPEVAADAAILFDPRIPTQIAQAMASLVEDEVLRARLIQAGQQRATEFSDAERMAREYWELFQCSLANEKHENLLTGAYADGWAGPTLNIRVAPAASAQTLEIEFSAPEWLPQSRLSVQASRGGKPQGVPLELARGASAVWSLPLEPAGGCYEVRIAPTFVPARSGHGDDQRELSAILQRCGIVRADGECIELFPEKVSA